MVAVPGDQRKGFQLNDLLVMKFGGTSVGSAERMRVAAAIAAEQPSAPPRGHRRFGDVQDHGPAARNHAPRRSR